MILFMSTLAQALASFPLVARFSGGGCIVPGPVIPKPQNVAGSLSFRVHDH